jgi:drug/metabolite transporter (DMT)-like permease
MFFGGATVAAVLAVTLGLHGQAPWPPAPAPGWLAGVAALALFFLAGNLALQYGAARLPANVTSVVMLTEVLFASVSALLLGGGTLSPPLLLGGLLILLAALLSALEPARPASHG